MQRTKPTLTERYKAQSQILNPQFSTGLDQPIDRTDLSQVEGELLRRQGTLDVVNKGHYYMPDIKTAEGSYWHLATLPALKFELKDLEAKFKHYSESQIKQGHRKPKNWPAHLESDRKILKAQIAVTEEEIKVLTNIADELRKAKDDEENALLPRSRMGEARMDYSNTIISIGGAKVTMNEEKEVLCIDDERSPFNGMEVYRYKGAILRAMEHERLRRQNQERKAAEKEGRKPKPVPLPKIPVYDQKKDRISYPGYSDFVLNKLNLR